MLRQRLRTRISVLSTQYQERESPSPPDRLGDFFWAKSERELRGLTGHYFAGFYQRIAIGKVAERDLVVFDL
jgi:hypothetical protein